jgi:hypothetical protein
MTIMILLEAGEDFRVGHSGLHRSLGSSGKRSSPARVPRRPFLSKRADRKSDCFARRSSGILATAIFSANEHNGSDAIGRIASRHVGFRRLVRLNG